MKETQITISARVPETLGEQVDRLAAAIRRNRSWVIEEALRTYVAHELQFLEAVDEGLKAVEEGRTVPHEQVVAEMEQRRAQLLHRPKTE